MAAKELRSLLDQEERARQLTGTNRTEPPPYANRHSVLPPTQAQLEKEAQEDIQYRQQLEQERRDHELALRLAQESNGQVEDSPPALRKYANRDRRRRRRHTTTLGWNRVHPPCVRVCACVCVCLCVFSAKALTILVWVGWSILRINRLFV